ncbi:hypothetical protein SANTM175S_06325 [Streptomyces antimycoticus]
MSESGSERGSAADDRLAPVLRPVRAGNGFEEALEQILQVLRLGLVPDGGRLPAERELADRLRISRVTLREVLKVLQDQGLVESRRGRYGGTFVRARPEPAQGGEDELRRRVAAVDVEDTLRFREVLEVGAAGLCAAHGLGEGQVRGCGRLWTRPGTPRWPTTAAWTPCSISRSRSWRGHRRSPPSTRPSARPSTTCWTASRCW